MRLLQIARIRVVARASHLHQLQLRADGAEGSGAGGRAFAVLDGDARPARALRTAAARREREALVARPLDRRDDRRPVRAARALEREALTTWRLALLCGPRASRVASWVHGERRQLHARAAALGARPDLSAVHRVRAASDGLLRLVAAAGRRTRLRRLAAGQCARVQPEAAEGALPAPAGDTRRARLLCHHELHADSFGQAAACDLCTHSGHRAQPFGANGIQAMQVAGGVGNSGHQVPCHLRLAPDAVREHSGAHSGEVGPRATQQMADLLLHVQHSLRDRHSASRASHLFRRGPPQHRFGAS